LFSGGGIYLENWGIISGGARAISLQTGPNEVRNFGVLSGDVVLGNSVDLFISTRGTVVGDIDGGAGNDTIRATVDNDRIFGGPGADVLTGGAGADVFVWAVAADTGLGRVARDVITDFQRGLDDIDLSAIDAKPGGANDVFRFVTGAFTAVGQVHVVQKLGERWVELNLDADKAAEVRIVLTGTGALAAGDFVL
jgi:Ca2+-binding RTX toxin-like protein